MGKSRRINDYEDIMTLLYKCYENKSLTIIDYNQQLEAWESRNINLFKIINL